MERHNESEFLHKEQCPACGSKDNLGRYSDGHGFCFGCNHYEPGDDEGKAAHPAAAAKAPRKGIIPGEYRALDKRGLTEKTCRRWSIQVGELSGKKVTICNYLDEDRNVVSQKIRFPANPDGSKEMVVTGEGTLGLYGKWLWAGFPRDTLVITEGEPDAASCDQVSGGQYASVSIQNGAKAAKKAILKDLKWISEFKKVIIAFDNDEPGREATAECVAALPPGKAYILELPVKDANDMLKEGNGGALLKAINNAKQYRPECLVNAMDLIEEAMEDPVIGLPFWDPRFTEASHGRKIGTVITMGAGVGQGKTDWLAEQIKFDRMVLKMRVCVFSFEQQNTETLIRVAGKYCEKPLHSPKGGWTRDEKRAALTAVAEDRGFVLYSPKGSAKWEFVKESIEYEYHANGTTLFYIDNLSAMAAQEKDEKTGLEQIQDQMRGLVLRLPIIIFQVSHLATPEGKGHEEGARVQEKHFKGSRSIAQVSAFMLAIEGDKQEADPSKQFKTFRVLKDRHGPSTGFTFPLYYDHARGKMLAEDHDDHPVSGFTDTAADY